MASRLRLYYPVRPLFVNQHFSENRPCVSDFGKPTQNVINSNTDGTCPVGSDKLYAHFGMTGHNGVDLRAGEQPIYAACSGTVIEQQTVPARGLGLGILTDSTVLLDHFGEHYAKLRYWHLKSFHVNVGDHVNEGDIIGITDNTGYSSADHLHFELNPMDKDAGGHPRYALSDSGTEVIDNSIDPEPFFCGIYADVLATEKPLLEKLVIALQQYLATFRQKLSQNAITAPSGMGAPASPATATPAIPSALQRVYAAAFASIGQDLSRTAPNEVGCAESLSRVLKTIYPDFPIILSTAELNAYLKTSPHFRATLYPQVGCVTVFPTTGASVGHCGVWGKNHVMSNDSRTGLWSPNYTHAGWTAAADQRGLPVFHYIPL